MEKSFVMVKPDGVRRKLVGEVISRLEKRNFEITAIKMLTPTRELAAEHYAMHKDKDFFEPLLDFTTSGPVVAMVAEGDNAIELIRRTVGATDPAEAAPGTIRGDLTIATRQNVVHASDSLEAAERELKLWFPELG